MNRTLLSLKAKREQGGFTLVELIVVLVILAILAAILVPTLLGYIDKARDEKNFAAAQTIRVACQAYTDEAIARGVDIKGKTIKGSFKPFSMDNGGATGDGNTKAYITKLAGIKETNYIYYLWFNVDDNGLVSKVDIRFNENEPCYYYEGGKWEARSTKTLDQHQ